MSFGVKLDMTRLLNIPDELIELADQAAIVTAGRVAQIAQDLAERDTSSMAESVYTVTSQGSTYGQAAAEAKSLNPKVEILPEVPSVEKGQSNVAAAAGHSIYREFGTVRSPAHPFMAPAAAEGEAIFIEEMTNSVGKLGQ